MGSAAKVGGTVPESDSSSTRSLAADGGSVAGSVAGIGVNVDGVQESPQVRVRAVAVGIASVDRVNLHEIYRRRAIVMRTVPTFLKGAFTSELHLRSVLLPGRMGTRHTGSQSMEVVLVDTKNVAARTSAQWIGSPKVIGGAFQKFRSRGVGVVGAPEHHGC